MKHRMHDSIMSMTWKEKEEEIQRLPTAELVRTIPYNSMVGCTVNKSIHNNTTVV